MLSIAVANPILLPKSIAKIFLFACSVVVSLILSLVFSVIEIFSSPKLYYIKLYISLKPFFKIDIKNSMITIRLHIFFDCIFHQNKFKLFFKNKNSDSEITPSSNHETMFK